MEKSLLVIFVEIPCTMYKGLWPNFEQPDNPLTKSYISTMPKSCWKPCLAVS